MGKMSEPVGIDEKGRLILPKKIREGARIEVPGVLIALAKGDGRVDSEMRNAKEIARRKLKGWREEDHEATRIAMALLKQGKK